MRSGPLLLLKIADLMSLMWSSITNSLKAIYISLN